MVVLVFTCVVKAQEPAYIHYGVPDGLPSSQVYQSIQDERGYMWFGTDRGLVRFDGYDFKVYTEEDGLASSVIFGFCKDRKKRIWMYTYAGGISYLEEDSIVTPAFNDSLIKVLGTAVIGSMYLEIDGTVWLAATRNALIVTISPGGKIEKQKIDRKRNIMHITSVDSEGFVFGYGIPTGVNKVGDKQWIVHRTATKSNRFELPAGAFYQRSGGMAIQHKKGIYCTQNKALIAFKDSTKTQQYYLSGHATMSLTTDRQNAIWVGMFHKGAVQFEAGDLTKQPRSYLKDYSVTSVYEDAEGGYWFTTLYAGIFYSSNLKVFSKRFNSTIRLEPISVIYIDTTEVLVGTENGKVYNYNRRTDQSALMYNGLKEVEYILKIDGSYIIGYNGEPRNVPKNPPYTYFIPGRIADYDQNTKSLYAHKLNYIQGIAFPESTVLVMQRESYGYKSVQAMIRWRNETYLGGINGLFRVKDIDRIQCPGTEGLWVVDIEKWKNQLYIATKNKGVVVYDTNQQIIRTFDQSLGLPVDHIEKIAIESDQVFWVGSKKGVSRVAIDSMTQEVSVVNIDVNNGLISSEVNDLILSNGELWVGTNQGMTYFSTDLQFRNTYEPPVYLDEIRINGVKYGSKQKAQLSHSASVFDFRFSGLNYKSSDPLTYKYRLSGLDENWRMTKNREVSYVLKPGVYTFEVLAQNNSGIWSKAPAQFQFEIETPYWERGWFVFLVFILIIAVVSLVIWRRWKVLQERNRLELKMVRSQQIALNAQLKPHFIFNALNSIHNFIRKNDTTSSSKYLILFSKLIRQILVQSNSPFVSIEEEMSMLEKYLQIEQLRFKNKMTYTIDIDPTLDLRGLQIPTQIIQPYVENAIWHGIMNKETEGHIQLTIRKVEAALHCAIEDDGIGITAAMQLQSEDYHESVGMEIGQQRLELIEATIKQPVSLKIIDLKDQSNKPAGTRVELILPIVQS